ncbi:MAG: L-glyceraldehyde 3-phosphate reductase [Bacteroidales bacterium]
MEQYTPDKERYNAINYRRCGRSGIKLPEISLGLWHNWGDDDDLDEARRMVRFAFDHGITHFDLANNYGPPAGSAERNFGEILKKDFQHHRDELLISTKAGWEMWPGPYGNFGSRKYLIASIDQSLKRLGVDYVDIFYHHRPDPETPLEETMGALDYIVRSGRALYVGISQYDYRQTEQAVEIMKQLGTPLLIHQARYNLFDRWIEPRLLPVLEKNGMGCIVFSPLSQGVLTSRYLDGIPEDSRAAKPTGFLQKEDISEDQLRKVKELQSIAEKRNQTLAQMSVAWVLRNKEITSALVGASKKDQLAEILEATKNTTFSKEELLRIEAILRS